MKAIIDQKHQKYVIVAVAAVISFVGLETLSLILTEYQLPMYFLTALLIYFLLLFLQNFVFDLHLKKPGAFRARFHYMFNLRHWLHFQNYLILPGMLFWSAVAILFLNPFDFFVKQAWIALFTMALANAYWYLKTVFYEHQSCRHRDRQLIFLTKIFAAFVAYASSLGLIRYIGHDPKIFSLAVFGITFLLFYQAFFQHHRVNLEVIALIFAVSLLIGFLGFFIYIFWPANYYSGALVLSAIYSAIWGVAHHQFIDRDLSPKIMYEYLAVLFVILVIIFSTTNFAQRI